MLLLTDVANMTVNLSILMYIKYCKNKFISFWHHDINFYNFLMIQKKKKKLIVFSPQYSIQVLFKFNLGKIMSLFSFSYYTPPKFICSSVYSGKNKQTNKQTKDQNSLFLKSTPTLKLLVNQFSNATSENSNESENILSSKYDIYEIHSCKMKYVTKNKYSI